MEPLCVGIIPDGNRRYAKKVGISLAEAYSKGVEKAKLAIRFLKEETNIKYVYFYTLSLENLKNRSKAELNLLFGLLRRELRKVVERGEDVAIRFGGRLDLLPRDIQSLMGKVEEVTEGNEPVVGLLVGYSPTEEVVRAAKMFKGNNYEEFRRGFYLPEFPDPDLILRTSGEMRLSGFIPLQASYAELIFYPKLWPEMEIDDFRKVLEEYSRRERRFGG